MGLASLPMYDLPELRAATDAWWSGLARALAAAGLAEVPAALARDPETAAHWTDPQLLLSQTCGYPFTHALAGRVRLVATPRYDAEGCEGPRYRSAFLVRSDDPAADIGALRGRRAAVNARESQSGYNCLRHAVAPLAEGAAFFCEVLVSGGHSASLAAVAAGRADLTAVDCVSYALLARERPAAVAGLRVLGWSAPAPALPYVTRAAADDETVARIRDGLARALADPALAWARAKLCLTGFEVLPAAAYERINEMEAEAEALGYPEIV